MVTPKCSQTCTSAATVSPWTEAVGRGVPAVCACDMTRRCRRSPTDWQDVAPDDPPDARAGAQASAGAGGADAGGRRRPRAHGPGVHLGGRAGPGVAERRLVVA